MCGRTACTLDAEEVRRASRYKTRRGERREPRWRDGHADRPSDKSPQSVGPDRPSDKSPQSVGPYRPSYNKSPQSVSPVLLSRRHFDEEAPVDECVLAAMRWGLIPAWFRETDPRKMQYSTNNCRSESLLEKKSYKDPFLKGQRCVILADGFYEWRRQGKEKQPFFIYFPQTQTPGLGEEEKASNMEEEGEAAEWTGWRLLTIAGLFDCWNPPGGGEPIYTYTVITVDASPNLRHIHDRMPAVLDGEDDVRSWLDFGEVKPLDALKLLQPTNLLTFHPVSSLVNNSRNNSPECLQPVDLQAKKEPKPTASSKVMMSWLKRKEPSTSDAGTRETQPKSSGPLQDWLQGAGKKPRVN